MGTNFYCKRIPTQEQLKSIADLVVNKKIDEAIDKLHEVNKKIHICKRSCGWQIGFDHNNGEYYQPTRKSLEEFLSQPDIVIFDEYNQKYTPEEFWKEIENCIHVDDSHFWQETYYKAHPEESFYKDNSERLINNTRWINRWFC